jgi:hypothetical protein
VKNDELELFAKELKLLDEAAKILAYSYEACRKIGIKESYALEELDKFEALTSRFARTSDILIQRIFRLIDVLELEKTGQYNRSNKPSRKKKLDFFRGSVQRNKVFAQ